VHTRSEMKEDKSSMYDIITDCDISETLVSHLQKETKLRLYCTISPNSVWRNRLSRNREKSRVAISILKI